MSIVTQISNFPGTIAALSNPPRLDAATMQQALQQDTQTLWGYVQSLISEINNADTSVSHSSTDDNFPTSKAVYDLVQEALSGGGPLLFPVTSVNSKTGDVALDASDVGAVATVNSVSPDNAANVTLNISNLGTLYSYDTTPPTYEDIVVAAPSVNVFVIGCSNNAYQGIAIVTVLSNNNISITKLGGNNMGVTGSVVDDVVTVRISHGSYIGAILHLVL